MAALSASSSAWTDAANASVMPAWREGGGPIATPHSRTRLRLCRGDRCRRNVVLVRAGGFADLEQTASFGDDVREHLARITTDYKRLSAR
jgi:hypothetical protein